MVNHVTSENINNLYESGCVLVVSPDKTLERCKLVHSTLALCGSNDFVGLNKCLPKPRYKSCLTCTADGKKNEAVDPTLPSKN